MVKSKSKIYFFYYEKVLDWIMLVKTVQEGRLTTEPCLRAKG